MCWTETPFFTIMASRAWMEGRVAFFEGRPDYDNPYLSTYERESSKDEWNTDASEWDDGWCQAHEEDENDN